MSWIVKVSSKAENYIGRLNKDNRKRIKEGLTQLSEYNNPIEHKNVKPLIGKLKGFYRLRIGDYRIVFSILREIHTIAVVNIAPRGDVYK
jgi:mRNA interferase RelE/StbE